MTDQHDPEERMYPSAYLLEKLVAVHKRARIVASAIRRHEKAIADGDARMATRVRLAKHQLRAVEASADLENVLEMIRQIAPR